MANYCIDGKTDGNLSGGLVRELSNKYNSAEWYREEIAKLYAIMSQDPVVKEKDFVSRGYVKEKLDRIMLEICISLHPALEPFVEKILKSKNGNSLYISRFESFNIGSYAPVRL